MRELRPSLLAAHKSKRRADGPAAKTINNELTFLSHAFQLAVKEWEWVAGLRQSEILNLQWCNVDLLRRTITLLEQKNGGRDTLPVNAKTLDVLQARAKV